MAILLYSVIAVIAFYFGFVIGKNKKYKRKTAKVKAPSKTNVDFIREYENFLSYDGSEQS
jgi:hypothetical protein